jgi:hypothetical protein
MRPDSDLDPAEAERAVNLAGAVVEVAEVTAEARRL